MRPRGAATILVTSPCVRQSGLASFQVPALLPVCWGTLGKSHNLSELLILHLQVGLLSVFAALKICDNSNCP